MRDDSVNASRLDPANANGFYESYFQRANHPSEPRAFWIRYTAFTPRGRPDDAVGQLWAVYFDGPTGRHVALKQVVPLAECAFSRERLDVRIGDATLDDGGLRGTVADGEQAIDWQLAYTGDEPPLLLFHRSSYERRFPAAKVLCGRPLATFAGTLAVNGARVPIDGWVGTQNHNWGSRHTDRYAWGQVAGFDDDPSASLECSTARLRLGPRLWTPRMSLLVVRLGDREIAFNSIRSALRTRGTYDYFSWRLDASRAGTRVRATFEAPKEAFVGLAYENPPGGTKTCLNTKLAGCRVVIEEPGKPPRSIETASRAAFEILTDEDSHGVPIAA